MADPVGGVYPVNGPFTYHLHEVPQTEYNRTRIRNRIGPQVFIVQKDADGNEYRFAEISPLVAPGEPEWAVRALNRAAKP